MLYPLSYEGLGGRLPADRPAHDHSGFGVAPWRVKAGSLSAGAGPRAGHTPVRLHTQGPMGLYLERMTPSFFSFGRKRRDAALREDERKGAGASSGSDQAASRRRFAADLGALAAAPSKPEPAT